MHTIVQPFFDSATFTMTYVLHDKISMASSVIDPVLAFALK